MPLLGLWPLTAKKVESRTRSYRGQHTRAGCNPTYTDDSKRMQSTVCFMHEDVKLTIVSLHSLYDPAQIIRHKASNGSVPDVAGSRSAYVFY